MILLDVMTARSADYDPLDSERSGSRRQNKKMLNNGLFQEQKKEKKQEVSRNLEKAQAKE